MSAGNDQTDGKAHSDSLAEEIDRTMAEAEAAVSARGSGDDQDDEEDQADPTSELAARVDALEAELASAKDRWLRAVADLDNYKKRVKREIDEAQTRTVQQILPSFLPVMDNLERALEIAEPAAKSVTGDVVKNLEQVVTGLRMVAGEFMAALGRHGIEPVPAVGQPFDPALHDALQQIDSAEYPPGVVVREFEKGYRLRERLIRPARVIVAGPGSTGQAQEPAEN